jgi:hypothetical protein
MDKEATKIIKEQRRKEKEEMKQRRVANSHTVINRTIEKLVEKRYKIDFNRTWFIVAIKQVRDIFHQIFQFGYRAHPLGYMGVNLGTYTIRS